MKLRTRTGLLGCCIGLVTSMPGCGGGAGSTSDSSEDSASGESLGEASGGSTEGGDGDGDYDGPDYTGTYSRTFDEPACSGSETFQIFQRGSELYVSERSTDCEGQAGVAGKLMGPIRIAGDGTLYDRGREAGTIGEAGLDVEANIWFAGCENGTIGMSLIPDGSGGFDYAESGSGCGAGLNVTGHAVRVDEPLVVPSEGVDQPHAVVIGQMETWTVEFHNYGSAAASNFGVADPNSTIAFVGGEYPGTGGSCSTELAAGESCTVVIEGAATIPAVASATLQAEWVGPNPDSPEGQVRARINLVGVGDLDGVDDLGVGQTLNHICVRRGTVVECESFQDGVDLTVVPPLSNPRDIDMSSVWACAIDDVGLHCWGNSNSGERMVEGLQQLSNDYAMGCANYGDDRSFECLTLGDDLYATDLDTVAPTDIAVGEDFICLVDEGVVKCLARDNGPVMSVPPELPEVVDVAAGHRWACANGDAGVACFDEDGALQLPPGLADVTMLRQEGPMACADVGGDLRCWGRANVHLPNVGPITAMDLSDGMGCFVGNDGLKCFARFMPFNEF